MDEARLLAQPDLLCPARALRAWTTNRPRAVVAEREIGQLASGFVGSPLVLGLTPPADIDCVQQIEVRIRRRVRLLNVVTYEHPNTPQ